MDEQAGGGHAPTLGASTLAWRASSTGDGDQLVDDDEDVEGVAALPESDFPELDLTVSDFPVSDLVPLLSEDVPDVDDPESPLRESVR
jgi:hypothetical protein